VKTISRLERLHGHNEPLQELRMLQAGPITAALDGVDLRYLRLGAVELVRRIYVSVRDRRWNEIPPSASQVEVDERAGSFDVRLSVQHESAETEFAWEGLIRGSGDGHVRFVMEGAAGRDMLYNRVGFCVLLPWRETAGRPFRGHTPDGPVAGKLPRFIAPQRIANGQYTGLFPPVARLEVDVELDGTVVFDFEGDLFEVEDQRNWGDASFKIYCTPLAVPRPRRLRKAQQLAQAVSVRTERADLSPKVSPRRLEIGGPTGTSVPAVGIGAPAQDLSVPDCELLRALRPAHLRRELHIRDAWEPALARTLDACATIGAAVEIALFLREEDAPRLARVREMLTDVQVARVLVAADRARSGTREESTPRTLIGLVREQFALDGVPIAGGTDMYFCELNRTHPPVDAIDGVFWSVNPQVHAFDDLSVLETPEALGEQVRAAHVLAGRKPLFVGPVTLMPRPNVESSSVEDEAEGGSRDLVDARQGSLLGAAWSAASVKHLAEHGVAAVTYFEGVGKRGVIPGHGRLRPPRASSGQPCGPYPLYHVLADVCELRRGEVLACDTTRPLELAGLAVRRAGGTTLLGANLTARPVSVEVAGLGGNARIRRLNEETADKAALNPAAFRSCAQRADVRTLQLAPYETVRIEVEEEDRR
jgi:D-apionolactonase